MAYNHSLLRKCSKHGLQAIRTGLASINLSSSRRWTAASLEVLFERRGKILEQHGKAKELEISQDQILGEEHYSDPQDQALYDKHTLSLCSIEALNAWDRIQKLEMRIKPYFRVKQGQREPFNDFFFF